MAIRRLSISSRGSHGSLNFGISPSSNHCQARPIKLLEINIDTSPSGIMPLHFGPVPGSGIPYPSVIVEVTPDEFDRIRLQELKLPDGWTIDEEYPRENA